MTVIELRQRRARRQKIRTLLDRIYEGHEITTQEVQDILSLLLTLNPKPAK